MTSTYYYDEGPDWLKSFNALQPVNSYRDSAWVLASPESAYRFADDRPGEFPGAPFGTVFPHRLETVAAPKFYETFRLTPFADRVTVSLALEILRKKRLSSRSATDMLAVSLSAMDYIGHQCGPDSREAEDSLLRLDREIARLLSAVDQAVGLVQTLVVVSSDHGIQVCPST